MDPMDKELKEQLAQAPWGQDGYSEALHKRIMTSLDEAEPTGQVHKRTYWRVAVSGAAVAMAALLVLKLGLLPLPGLPFATSGPEASSPAPYGQAAASAPATDYESTIRSALLVGLRTDTVSPEGERSTYRTLLIAPEHNRLTRIAEGSGIVMPYKLDFWRLLAVESRAAGAADNAPPQTVRFEATLAKNKRAGAESAAESLKPFARIGETEASGGAGAGSGVREKLLFVGNRYIALEQQTAPSRARSKDVSSGQRYVMVKELPQLSSSSRASSASLDPTREPHVKLGEALGDDYNTVLKQLQEASTSKTDLMKTTGRTTVGKPAPGVETPAWGDSWTVSRKQGKWVAQLAQYDELGTTSGRAAGYKLQELELTLPESIVAHDELAVPWSHIRSTQPAALDAFTSPNQDIALVRTASSLVIYPLQSVMLPNPLLTIQLQPGEQIIMLHWATDPYIEAWKSSLADYFTP
ncbi:hypothetical protein [Paenibacillus sp. YYML68]|uniref:hypothetical protein n=1 Tax=Paenibacillus sp. YYML68 TaxID=2909250 RepID=UPI002490B5A5|nr:hypothetical protein [Paenibacillus sp. YYML68]